MSEPAAPPRPHHVGYVVEDLETAAARFAATHGGGPFFAIEHLPFEEVTFLGEAAHYDHSSAFGVWGPLIAELTVVHACEPQGLRDALVAPGGGIGHIGFLADSLTAETLRLQEAGYRPFHAGRSGVASAVWFEGGPLGHPLEVLQRRPELESFYAAVRAASAGWDGREPLRSAAALRG